MDIDGTPVLDIKPVFMEFQVKTEIRQQLMLARAIYRKGKNHFKRSLLICRKKADKWFADAVSDTTMMHKEQMPVNK